MSTHDDDRLTFGEGPLEGRLDIGPADGDADVDAPPKRSRTFVYVGATMAALVLLGVVALVVTMVYWLPAEQERRMAEATGTASALTRVAAASTATPAPTSTPLPPPATPTFEPTQTPAPTPTSTRVVGADRVEGLPALMTATPQLPETTPDAGLGIGGMAAAAVGLTALLAVARGVRGQE